MAAGEAIGCFGLTEPDYGSDPGVDAHPRPARRRRLGARRRARCGSPTARSPTSPWCGRATDDGDPRLRRADRHARASRRPRSSTSCRCAPRSPASSSSTASGCPPTRCCPEVRGLKGPLSCLTEARFGIVWGVARRGPRLPRDGASLRRATASSSAARSPASSSPRPSSPTWRSSCDKGQLLALHLGRRKDAGTLRPEQVSLGKLNNVREALEIGRTAPDHPRRQRDQRWSTRCIRHANNLESVLTYEGTVGDAHPRRRAGPDRPAGLPVEPVGGEPATRHTADFTDRLRTL